MGGGNQFGVSADWPGAWCDEIRAAYGEHIVPLVINGCCGNVLHRDPLDPSWVNDHNRSGRFLAETTAGILKCIDMAASHTMTVRSTVDSLSCLDN